MAYNALFKAAIERALANIQALESGANEETDQLSAESLEAQHGADQALNVMDLMASATPKGPYLKEPPPLSPMAIAFPTLASNLSSAMTGNPSYRETTQRDLEAYEQRRLAAEQTNVGLKREDLRAESAAHMQVQSARYAKLAARAESLGKLEDAAKWGQKLAALQKQREHLLDLDTEALRHEGEMERTAMQVQGDIERALIMQNRDPKTGKPFTDVELAARIKPEERVATIERAHAASLKLPEGKRAAFMRTQYVGMPPMVGESPLSYAEGLFLEGGFDKRNMQDFAVVDAKTQMHFGSGGAIDPPEDAEWRDAYIKARSGIAPSEPEKPTGALTPTDAIEILNDKREATADEFIGAIEAVQGRTLPKALRPVFGYVWMQKQANRAFMRAVTGLVESHPIAYSDTARAFVKIYGRQPNAEERKTLRNAIPRKFVPSNME